MSFAVCVYLYCDGGLDGCECQCFDRCGNPDGFCEASGGDSPYTTKKDYKRDMIKQGWVFRGTDAFCPKCISKIKNQEGK